MVKMTTHETVPHVKEVETATTELTQMLKDVPQEILPPMFLLFAEFLGYVSPLLEWADKAATKSLEVYQQRILTMDANVIFQRMQKEFTMEEIKDYWDQIYPVALNKYEAKFREFWTDDLPF